RRQRRVEVWRHERCARLLGGDALAALAHLLGDPSPGLPVRDQRERAPVDLHAVAVLALDPGDPHRGVVAPRAQIVREDVQPNGAAHAPPNTVGWATSVLSACSAVSTIRRRKAFSSSGDSSALPRGWMMPAAGTTRLAPTITATGVIVDTCTVG